MHYEQKSTYWITYNYGGPFSFDADTGHGFRDISGLGHGNYSKANRMKKTLKYTVLLIVLISISRQTYWMVSRGGNLNLYAYNSSDVEEITLEVCKWRISNCSRSFKQEKS